MGVLPVCLCVVPHFPPPPRQGQPTRQRSVRGGRGAHGRPRGPVSQLRPPAEQQQRRQRYDTSRQNAQNPQPVQKQHVCKLVASFIPWSSNKTSPNRSSTFSPKHPNQSKTLTWNWCQNQKHNIYIYKEGIRCFYNLILCNIQREKFTNPLEKWI